MPALTRILVAIALGTSAVWSAVVAAEEGSAVGRLVGMVTDLDDRPVAGAEVTLRPLDATGSVPAAARTDERGDWAIAGLAAGRWTITVKAAGYLTATGWVDVREGVATAPVSVALRPLAEVTPTLAENPGSVLRWLGKGNDLLEQGHYAAARAEYEKALDLLPPESRAEVLRAMARTWFLEGRSAETVATLQRALRAAPDDETTRRLFTEVLRQLGREPEALELLAALDRDGVAALSRSAAESEVPERVTSATPGLPPEVAELPVEAPVAGRTGHYRTSFTTKSPHGDLGELLRRLGLDSREIAATDPHDGQYDLSHETFQLYVPDSPAPSGRYGVLVYVSPGGFGGFVRDEVREILDERGLIWIGADGAGNRRARWTRMSLALDAIHNLKQLYRIDERRVYVSGYSGGGRITSGLAMLYPDIFRGGLSLFGCDYFRRVDMPDKPGAYWPPRFPPPPSATLRRLKAESRFVLLTGELDFNRLQTKAVYEEMMDDGFENVRFLVVPGTGHYQPVERQWLEMAIAFLEGATAPG